MKKIKFVMIRFKMENKEIVYLDLREKNFSISNKGNSDQYSGIL